MTDRLQFTPLGGLGEVGMNNMLIRCGSHSFLLDCGTASSHTPWLGFDSVAPDYAKIFSETLPWPTEIVITHAHEDHIGALPHFLRSCPHAVKIHATAFTADVIRKKLGEYPSLRNFYEIEEHRPQQSFDLGPWRVRYFFNNHSIVDSHALLFEQPGFRFFHTGDFRIDDRPYKDPRFDLAQMLERLGPVDLLLSDSTNAEKPGRSLCEADIGANFSEIIAGAEKAVVLSLFASNVRRLQHLIEAARENGRKFCFVGRSMRKFVDLAQSYDYFQIGEQERIAPEQLGNTPKKDYVLFVTGSQGEFQAALSRIVYDQFSGFYFESGDVLIHSALQIPGNELRIRSLLNRCIERGVRVFKNSPERILHTTGHAYADELAEVLATLQPKAFLPVHGDGMMMQRHAEIARRVCPRAEVFTIQNASSLIYEYGQFSRQFTHEDLPRSWLRQDQFGSIDSQEIRDKKRIAREGLVYFLYREESLFMDQWQVHVDAIGCHFLEHEGFEASRLLESLRKDFYRDYKAPQEIDTWFRLWLRSYFRRRYSQKPMLIVKPMLLSK